MRRRAQAGDVVGKRDYALLLLYLATGLRRSEVISLRGKDVHPGETLVLAYRAKGRDYRSREVRELRVKEALVDYLTASDRLHALKTDAPLWTRHDRASKPGEALTSHCFVKNLKKYAKEAGVEGFHLHRTRHAFARIVSEVTGTPRRPRTRSPGAELRSGDSGSHSSLAPICRLGRAGPGDGQPHLVFRNAARHIHPFQARALALRRH